MKLGEAISEVEKRVIISGLFNVREEGDGIHAAFSASCTYEEAGASKTERGNGYFIIAHDNKGNFTPIEAQFEATGKTETRLWKWDGEKLELWQAVEPSYGGVG